METWYEIYRLNIRIQFKYEKTRTRKTPNTDSFHVQPTEYYCIPFHMSKDILCTLNLFVQETS